MKSFKSTTILLLLVIFISSCTQKKDSQIVLQTLSYGTLLFHLHTNIDSTEVLYGDTSLDASGRKLILSVAQFYISGITAQKTDGSKVNFPGVYLLKKLETEPYIIGNVPVGEYKSVSFDVGLDSLVNSITPTFYSDSTNVLGTQVPSMWFGSISQGYIFMNVQGFADTSISKNGIANFPFSYKIGSTILRRTVTMPQQNYTVYANQEQAVHMVCDYGKLLQGIDFKTQNTTDTYSVNPSLANQIANNIPSMFRYTW